MPDLLVRNIDAVVYRRMKRAARAQGKSLTQTAREALAEKFSRSKKDIWTEIDQFRESMGPVAGDSTEVIRKMRDRVRSGY